MTLSMPPRILVLAFFLLCSAAWPREAVSPAAGKAPAATLKRDAARCRAHDIDACYDAVRWNPGDPALLVNLGDALVLAKRPEDALRNYQRAAALAPATHGLAAKISATEAKLAAKHAPAHHPGDRDSGSGASGKRYSNAAPEAQSH